MADEKTPRPKIELEGKEERPEAPAPDDGSYTVGEAVRDGSARLFAWVRRTFPSGAAFSALWRRFCSWCSACSRRS
mgnify:CR=1 FL=1